MQSLLKAMNCDLQGLWIARLARDPLLVSGLLLPVWCVGARTRFLMTYIYVCIYISVKMAAPWGSLTLLSYYSLCTHLRSH